MKLPRTHRSKSPLDIKPVTQPHAVIGMDLGVKALATLSNGEVIQGPKAHTALLKHRTGTGGKELEISSS
ncbi:MAG: hypothetical protein WCF79_14120 [Rhodomicrobium sp.]